MLKSNATSVQCDYLLLLKPDFGARCLDAALLASLQLTDANRHSALTSQSFKYGGITKISEQSPSNVT